MSECLYDTLSEITDRAMIRFGIDKKKHLSRYLILAEECWEEVFQNTLQVIKSVWQPTKAGTPYNYIQVPSDCLRLFSVGTDDKCGLIQPIFYNNQINVVSKPTSKKCGCSCDCAGLCESVNSMVATTKVMFTINNINYYQKSWLKYCQNGDVLEYQSTPVKKYNNTAGDAGDFNSDFNNDYDIASAPFSDFTIVYIESQKKICKLETQPCGCPVESETNDQLFLDCCGFYVNWNCRNKKRHCKQFSPNINNNRFGEVKISECGTKIYFNPSHHWRDVGTKEIPDYLLINYQSTGTSAGSETLVPVYARNLMYSMMDSARKEYNGAYSLAEKQEANYKKIDEKNKIIGYLNPFSIQDMAAMQDIPTRW